MHLQCYPYLCCLDSCVSMSLGLPVLLSSAPAVIIAKMILPCFWCSEPWAYLLYSWFGSSSSLSAWALLRSWQMQECHWLQMANVGECSHVLSRSCTKSHSRALAGLQLFGDSKWSVIWKSDDYTSVLLAYMHTHTLYMLIGNGMKSLTLWVQCWSMAPSHIGQYVLLKLM